MRSRIFRIEIALLEGFSLDGGNISSDDIDDICTEESNHMIVNILPSCPYIGVESSEGWKILDRSAEVYLR